MNTVLLAFFSPGPMEMLVIGVIAVLLFGKRLPEVGRSLGKGLMEFKRGINGIEDEVRSSVHSAPRSSSRKPAEIEDREEATAPKFEPPPAASGSEANSMDEQSKAEAVEG